VAVSTFFDRQHSSELRPLPLAFRLLRRWEVTRVETAARLLKPGEKALDVGCGDGELACRVADRFRSMVIGDVAPVAVERSAQRLREAGLQDRIQCRVLDADEELPFADGEFDTLVCMGTLYYLFDPEAFLAEAWRVTAPGGQLLVEVSNMAYLPQRLRLLIGRPIRTSFYRHGIDGGNLHYFTVGLIERLVREAGFAPRRVTGSGIFAALRTWWVSLLCANVILVAEKPA
jgi:SAM-dependent methyltransferase